MLVLAVLLVLLVLLAMVVLVVGKTLLLPSAAAPADANSERPDACLGWWSLVSGRNLRLWLQVAVVVGATLEVAGSFSCWYFLH
jgi:hypothetical protein